MYNPTLDNRQALVSFASVDDHAAKGWLLVNGTTPAPSIKNLTVELADLRYVKLGDVVTGNTDAGALTSGTLPPARIADGSLPATKLTGTIPDALIPASIARDSEVAAAVASATALIGFDSYTYDLREFRQAGETLVSDGSGPGNNTAILQRAVDALSTGTKPRMIYAPDGDYILAQSGTDTGVPFAVRWKTLVGLVGESTKGTRFLSDASSTPFFAAYGNTTLVDVTFRTFTVDCAAQTSGGYTTQLKGMFMQRMLRPHWDRVRIMNSWGTGLGCDALQDYRIDHHIGIGCGRGVGATNSNPLNVSGGSGIGIGTGLYQDERGVITSPILLNNGRVGLFYETQPSYTYHSRGHAVAGGVAAGNAFGLHDCGCDGLEVTGMALVDNTYAGLLLSGTNLEPNAGYNGHFNGTIARNGLVSDPTSGGVVIGSAPSGRYVIEGQIYGNAAGVNTRADAIVGPGIKIDADVRDNLGAGVLVSSTNTTPVRGLTVSGRVISNGRSATPTRREGVVIGVPTTNLTVSAQITDDQNTKTQAAGIYLRGAALTATSARITSDLRGNLVPFQSEQTLTDLSYTGVGATLTDPSSLTATSGNGQVALSWGTPVAAGDVTDYRVEYRTSPSGTWTTVTRTASTTATQTVTGLTNGTAYDFRVAALRGATLSGYTNTVTATPAVPTGPAVYSDDFNRADDASVPGPGWTTSTGTWGIASGRLRLFTTSVIREVLRTANRTSANHGITVLPIRGASTSIGATIRRVDADNHYSCRINSSNNLALIRTVGGTASVLGAEHPWTAGQRIGIEAFGNTLRLLLDGAVVETQTVSDATLATATRIGLRATGASTTPPEFDDFNEYDTSA
jgi:hypothetical protein